MPGDDPVHHRQPEAGSFAHSLGRKKRLEDAVDNLLLHAAAGVGNANPNKIVPALGGSIRGQYRHFDRYRCAGAADGLEGLRTFRTLQPDLVITDLIMPVKEGLDTIRLLRTWSPEAKIIAISGGGRVANTDLLAEAAVLGASVVIAKPFEPDELIVKVSNCLAA